jgi:hypothetical protein
MAVVDIARRAAIAALVILAPSMALADAIDGDWCSPTDGKQFSIAGANITTSAGTKTTGNYSRHAFSYVVPVGDPGAGDDVDMLLLNEEEVQVSVNGGAPEIWRRCHLNV